jgi:hypothetical protein
MKNQSLLAFQARFSVLHFVFRARRQHGKLNVLKHTGFD